MWECKLCNYNTKLSANFQRHLNTTTHISLFNKNNEIQQKRKEERIKKETILYNKLDKIEKYQIETSKDLETIKTQQETIKKYQINTSKNVKKITDYIDFLNKHCSDAEPLTLLKPEEVDGLLKIKNYDPEKFEEMIIYYMRKKILHKKLGDLILEKYLNPKDLTKQNVWTSDISRLIYLILQTIGEQKNWIRDKKGEIFTELITKPIIDKLTKIMRTYAKYKLDNYNEEDDNDINAELLTKVQFTSNFVDIEYCNNLKKDILKYMASKFSISVKKDEIINLSN